MIKNIKRKINKDKKDKEEVKEDMSKEEDCSEKEILDKIKTESETQYKQKIENDMIEYIKENNNKDIKYEDWLRGFNILDWEQEFNYESEKRENKVYHDIWDILTEFVIIY
jgi:hypothetical protein